MKTAMHNQLKLAAIVAVLPLALSSVQGSPISLDFSLPSLPSGGGNGYEQILNYYNGGTDQYGDTGPNYGISFGSAALALGQYPLAPGSNTGDEPGGGNALFFLNSGSSAIMNVAGGFTTGFSFYYCAYLPGTINVYSGVNDTGTLLASLTLPAVGVQTTIGEPYFGREGWTPIGVSFSGTAESVDFGGTANEITFADVTFGSATPMIGNNVPDNTGPTIYLFAALGLAGMVWVSRKQNTAIA
jgi:hypothetical protein